MNLVPLLTRGKDKSLDDRAVFQYYPFYDLRWGLTPNASIRVGDYKLIEVFGDRVDASNRYRPGHRVELYNLRDDIGETQNLADRLPELTRRLRARLRHWMRDVGAVVPVNNARHDVERSFLETRDKPAWLKDALWSGN